MDKTVDLKKEFYHINKIIEPDLIYSCLKRIKDIMPIVMMYIGVIIGVCYTEIPKETLSKSTLSTSLATMLDNGLESYKTYDCFGIMKTVTFIAIVLLVFNALMIMYHLSDNPKTMKYYTFYHLMNIFAYGFSIYYSKFSGLLCTELHDNTSSMHNTCYYYTNAVVIFSIIMIAVYCVSFIFTYKRVKKEEAEAKKIINNL